MVNDNYTKWLEHRNKLLDIKSTRAVLFKDIEILTYKQDGWVGEFFLDNTRYYVYGENSRQQTIDKCCEEIIVIKWQLPPYNKNRID